MGNQHSDNLGEGCVLSTREKARAVEDLIIDCEYVEDIVYIIEFLPAEVTAYWRDYPEWLTPMLQQLKLKKNMIAHIVFVLHGYGFDCSQFLQNEEEIRGFLHEEELFTMRNAIMRLFNDDFFKDMNYDLNTAVGKRLIAYFREVPKDFYEPLSTSAKPVKGLIAIAKTPLGEKIKQFL